MSALGGFVITFFPLFLLDAVFGRLMEASGAARLIASTIVARLGADRALLAVVVACAVLTYGGVSLFVVAFAVYPVAAALFQEARIPKRLIPATLALGAFTFTMTALPGTPSIQNVIPMPYFVKTPFAAPGLGLIAKLAMLTLGMLWLLRRASMAQATGEGYGGDADSEADWDTDHSGAGRKTPVAITAQPSRSATAADLARAIVPALLVIVLNYLLSTWLLPALNKRYLAEPRFGATNMATLRGIWAVIVALAAAIALLILLQWRSFADLKGVLAEGACASVLPLMNTASQVGYGAVIATLSGFALIRDAVLGIAPDNPLVSMSVNILAGITGSASGGMSIALQTLGDTWLTMGRAAGIAPELLHRVTALATGGLDALPHIGAVITLLAICKLSHRQAYFDIFMVAVAATSAALVVVVLLISALGSFLAAA